MLESIVPLAREAAKALAPDALDPLIDAGARAIIVINAAFLSDPARREAEVAVLASELKAGRVPSVLEAVLEVRP